MTIQVWYWDAQNCTLVSLKFKQNIYQPYLPILHSRQMMGLSCRKYCKWRLLQLVTLDPLQNRLKTKHNFFSNSPTSLSFSEVNWFPSVSFLILQKTTIKCNVSNVGKTGKVFKDDVVRVHRQLVFLDYR